MENQSYVISNKNAKTVLFHLEFVDLLLYLISRRYGEYSSTCNPQIDAFAA
jgi:hypothetical protein